MTDGELLALGEEANEALARLSPEERAEHWRRQRISFAYGNTKLSNPDVTLEMVEEAAKRNPGISYCFCAGVLPGTRRANSCLECSLRGRGRL